MLVSLVTLVLSQDPNAGAEKIDQVQMLRGQAAWDLEWSDAEDRMHGTLRPLDPVAERPVELSVLVGTFQGAEFDGPVSMTMRCEEWSQTQTVTKAKGERGWFAHFVPPGDGDCSIDVGFKTTRHKLLHLKVYVTQAPLSRAPWYAIVGLLISIALGLGIRAVFKKSESA